MPGAGSKGNFNLEKLALRRNKLGLYFGGEKSRGHKGRLINKPFLGEKGLWREPMVVVPREDIFLFYTGGGFFGEHLADLAYIW